MLVSEVEMRSDMAKVIVERPRGGQRLKSPKGYHRRLQRIAPEDQLKRESITRPWVNSGKWLSERLGPLRKYLWSQLGRPWDKVFSEICQHIRLDSAVQSHVRDHIGDFVEVSVELVNGVPYAKTGWRRSRRVDERMLYVCPKTGLLRAGKRQQLPPITQLRVNDSRQFRCLNGIWYEVAVRRIPSDPEGAWDARLDKPVYRFRVGEATATYGAEVYALSKRKVSNNELNEVRRLLEKKKKKR
jgi:hypothetical protein